MQAFPPRRLIPESTFMNFYHLLAIRARTAILGCCLLSLFAAPVASAAGVPVAECKPGQMPNEEWQTAFNLAQEAFAARAEHAVGALPAREPIHAAIGCFREALRLAPERFDVRIGLLHALLFEGEYAARSKNDRKQAFLEGRDLFEDTLDLLSRLAGMDFRKLKPEQVNQAMASFEEARPIFFLGALHWGLWADYFGTIAAVRAGVAKKIRVLAETTLAVTPDVDGGGAHRLMGRLHFLTPRIPFVTSWVDRKRSLIELEKALLLGPADPLNLAFLAEAVAEIGHDRARAKQLLLTAVSTMPRLESWVEDMSAIEEAKKIRRELKL